VVNTGVTHFSIYDSEFLYYGGTSEHFSIEDLTITEDLFLRTEVSEEETFKVGGIPLYPIRTGRLRHEKTKVKVGLYQINETMEEWASDLTARLCQNRGPDGIVPPDRAREEFKRNPEWVNDDTTLIARCLDDTAAMQVRNCRVILVSDDIRLGNQMSNTCNVTVLRISSLEYVEWIFQEYGIAEPMNISPQLDVISTFIEHRGRLDPIRFIYLDSGSIASAAARLEMTMERGRPKLVKRVVTKTGVRQGKRFVQYTLSKTDVPLFLRTTVHNPILRQRKHFFQGKGANRGQSRSLGALSWRSGSEV